MAFRKRGLDVYDFTLLQRKGLVEKPQEKEEQPVNVDSQGYFDFSSGHTQQSSQQESPSVSSLFQPQVQPEMAGPQTQVSPPAQSSDNPLAFFDTFAQNASTQEPESGLPQPINHNDPTELVDLKVKLEDFEYKLERLTDKLILIEARLDEFGNTSG